jgi:2',3'-cyclic-nucleotide 2'-phosphodiesterase/3'-nucleotidase
MKRISGQTVLFSAIIILSLVSCSGTKNTTLVLLETTDVHGMILPYDYVEKRESKNSLASVMGYISGEKLSGEKLVLLDNGDNLQGQPIVYYYNFEDTTSPHINSLTMNYMGYDAVTVGNHDIEAGHSVYDRLRAEYKFPMLAANAIDKKSGKPYFAPYTIIKKNGIKVAVFGMVTFSIPEWLPPRLYDGMEFRDVVETAKLWMPEIKKEKPDLIVGLFHTGWDKVTESGNPYTGKNDANMVAINVPGFDVIFTGHDHASANEKIVNIAGDTVLVLDGGSHASVIARADVYFKKKKAKKITGTIVDIKNYPPDSTFVARFSENDKAVRSYVDKVIGESVSDVSSRDSYFGPSAFTGMIHSLQLELTGADISFAAPLSFDVEIAKGPVTVSDMFKLYRFENMLYTMSLTGEEIVKYLEFSYSGWLNTMKNADDHLINFRTGSDGKVVINSGRARLKAQPYNFDSAAGIDYTVDATKPSGQRVEVRSFSNGKPFKSDEFYKVALNSYRGSGGGGHLIEGAGLSREELNDRLISSTDRDLRFFIIRSIEQKKIITPSAPLNWKIIPENYVRNAYKRDYKLMFGNSDY